MAIPQHLKFYMRKHIQTVYNKAFQQTKIVSFIYIDFFFSLLTSIAFFLFFLLTHTSYVFGNKIYTITYSLISEIH